MEKVITAIKTLLEVSIATPGSVLSDIKKVYFWDPQQIPESCQPAITLQPITTDYLDRGPWAIQKTFTVEARLVYNQKQYYGKGESSVVSASWAVYDASFKEIQISKTAHGLKVGDAVVLQASPSIFSGTFSVSEVLDADSFVVPKTNAGAELTQSLSNVSYKTVETENIFAVLDAIRKIDGVEVWWEPATDTIAGIITVNPTLKYLVAWVTVEAAELARVESVEYRFSTNRWFPTYEISVRIKATRVKRRTQSYIP